MEALRGVRVLEVGGEVAVRYCGRLFARLGADVVRVGAAGADERLGQGGAAGAAYGAWLDQGKVIVPEVPQQSFDLVIGGQGPAEAAGVRELAARLPGTPPALCLTWFGETGPYAHWRGHDAILQALTGVSFTFGEAAGPPILAQGHAPQLLGGLNGFIAGLAALMSDPRPARIDVNVLESALCFAEPGAVAAPYTGLPAHRLGVNRFAPSYPCQVYAASDGWIGITALTPAQWRALAALIGHPALADVPDLTTSVQRLMAADALDAVIAPVIATRSVMDWVRDGDRLRIPIAPVRRPAELPDDPHWRDRGSFAPIGDGAGLVGPDLPFRADWDGHAAPRPPPGALGPRAGLKVADFSMGWAGPLAGRHLADLGADVRKVESAVRPDWWRGWEVVPEQEPPLSELARNFMVVNRNKRGLDLDLSTAAGLAQAKALIADADVVIENLGPGVMAGLGLGPADQRQLKPGIISISMPPFGRSGPLSGLRAYGSTVEHASGMPFVNGHEGWAPCLQHVAYGDPVAGLYAAAAALTALYARERLGGADIELCQVECLFQLGAEAIIGEQALGAPSPRQGSARTVERLCTVVAAGDHDTWLAVVAEDEARWAMLGRAVGAAPGQDLEAALAFWAGRRSAADAADELQAAGVTAAPVTRSSDLAADPHLAAADYWVVQHRRHLGEHLTPAAPMRFDGRRPAVRTPAPVLGEHTDEVLAELPGGRR